MSCYGSIGPISIGDCSAKSKLSINTSNISKSVTNSAMSSLSSNESKTSLIQLQNVAVDASCCIPDISQKFDAKLVNVSKMTDKFSSSTAKTMSTAIDNALKANQSQINDLFGSTVGPSLTAAINSKVKNFTESNSFKQALKKNMTDTFGSQAQNISITCSVPAKKPEKCKVSQEFFLQQALDNTMASIFNEVNNDSTVQKIVSDFQSKQETENKGLTSLVSAILNPWVIIGVVVVAIVFLKFKSGR